jgi:hypothetical protein
MPRGTWTINTTERNVDSTTRARTHTHTHFTSPSAGTEPSTVVMVSTQTGDSYHPHGSMNPFCGSPQPIIERAIPVGPPSASASPLAAIKTSHTVARGCSAVEMPPVQIPNAALAAQHAMPLGSVRIWEGAAAVNILPPEDGLSTAQLPAHLGDLCTVITCRHVESF